MNLCTMYKTEKKKLIKSLIKVLWALVSRFLQQTTRIFYACLFGLSIKFIAFFASTYVLFPLLVSLIVRRMNNTNMIRSNNMKMKCAWGFDVKNGDVDVFIHNSCIWSTFEWILRHEVSVDFTVRKQKKSAKLMKSAKRQSKKTKHTICGRDTDVIPMKEMTNRPSIDSHYAIPFDILNFCHSSCRCAPQKVSENGNS